MELKKDTIQQQKMEMLGSLVPSVVHEINNPVNGIINYATLLRNNYPKDEKIQKFSQAIILEGNRLSQLASGLLNFSKPEEAEIKPLTIEPLVEHTLQLLSSLFKKLHIDYSVSITSGLPVCLGIEQYIIQILLNLLLNAKDACLENNIQDGNHIKINVKPLQRADKNFVVIEVIDNGVGIQKQYNEKLFTPFFSTKVEGTGLGLTICQKLVHAQNGKISFEVLETQESCFRIELPAVEV